MENIQKEASKARVSLAKQSQFLVLPEEILALQKEVGPISIKEANMGYILNEIKFVFETMYDGFTPEEKALLEENAKNRIPESEYLPVETLKRVEAAKKSADYELGRIMKKVHLLALYEEELSKVSKLMMEGWRQFKDWQITGFERQERSLRHYLAGKNWIVPADGHEFLDWFLRVKHREAFIQDLIREKSTAKPSDFREFHEWKEPQVWEGLKTILPMGEEQRNSTTPKARANTRPKKVEVLSSFQDVYKSNLKDLWLELSKMPIPLVSKSGIFTREGENVSVLMALAQALVTAERINGGHKQESVYRMLCRHFKIPETERPRIKAHTASGYTEVYSEYLTAFNDLFSE